MMEEWRAVPGYEGLYEVSNIGNVRNVRRNTLLRLQKTNKGYIRVSLCKNGIQTGFQVHRLVAQAFIPNPNNLPQVNHRDENPSNNNVDNLEWCTAKYNINYGTARIRSINTKIKNGYINEENVGLSEEEWRKKYYEGNREKIREKIREYKKKNREKIRENNKEYREKNREKIREHMREYYENNKEKYKEYYENNKEKNKEKYKEYREKNREKYREKNREYMREYRKKRKNK